VVISSNAGFHVRNLHQGRYDFSSFGPEFASSYLIKNKYNSEDTIDWKNEVAVKALNRALLKSQYNVHDWTVPDGYLVPPIPSRADYVHHMADLVLLHSSQVKDKPIVGLDLGCGANCIYSLIATSAYPNWRMLAVDIDPRAVEAAKKNAERNRPNGQIVVCTQPNPKHYFRGVIASSSSSSSSYSLQPPDATGKETKDLIAFTICNPPFASSQADADAGTKRKLANLAPKSFTRQRPRSDVERNFAGQSNELWCPGGELAFVKGMISESALFSDRVVWFSSLISKEANIVPLQKMLSTTTTPTTKRGVKDVRIVEMQHGNKKSRILAWTFF